MSNVTRKIVVLGSRTHDAELAIAPYVRSIHDRKWLLTTGVLTSKMEVRVDDHTVGLVLWLVDTEALVSAVRKTYLRGGAARPV
jgi:hypothetical protein